MEQMIVSWSMVMVHALMVAGLSLVPILARCWGGNSAEAPGVYGTVNQM